MHALRRHVLTFIGLCLWPLLGLGQSVGWLDGSRALMAASDLDNWLLHGRTYAEERYTPLAQINADNVQQLGVAWYVDANTNRGLEATPIVVDGVIYVTGTWSMVFALDARTGAELWRFDPQVPRTIARAACCDVVNRGVAVWQGKVFVGTLDGRLVALDAATGERLWETMTVDSSKPYTITGAPRIAGGTILIGNGGAEYGVRGYVSAYDPDSGEMLWRFYTIPGNPAEGFERPELAMAAQTWNGEWWKVGGGGTVWDSMAYDPELDLVYIGVGNGSPWNRRLRSPGGGDNLFLSSIVALRPATGEYVWHYQVVPSESWDYTATQHMILADLTIDGQPRKVLMQAPKSGFFMVIDRESGKLISAEPFVEVNWASHYDLQTGRPVEVPGADYQGTTAFIKPSSGGAHNWQPMAYNPETGLVYIPAMESSFGYTDIEALDYEPGLRNTGIDRTGNPPWDELFNQIFQRRIASGHLLAWDPVKQVEVWRNDLPTVWNGGVLTTGGNLVFQGAADGHFSAYRADTGERLWRHQVNSGILAAPVTYRVDGEQYVLIAAGGGGAFGLMSGLKPPVAPRSRFIAYKLGGQQSLPVPPKPQPLLPAPARLSEDAVVLQRGAELFANYCSYCHGVGVVSGETVPDLRRLPHAFYDIFEEIVLQGVYEPLGMPRFDDVLDAEDVHAIKAYVIDRAHMDRELQALPAWQLTLLGFWYEIKAWLIALFLEGSSHSA